MKASRRSVRRRNTGGLTQSQKSCANKNSMKKMYIVGSKLMVNCQNGNDLNIEGYGNQKPGSGMAPKSLMNSPASNPMHNM